MRPTEPSPSPTPLNLLSVEFMPLALCIWVIVGVLALLLLCILLPVLSAVAMEKISNKRNQYRTDPAHRTHFGDTDYFDETYKIHKPYIQFLGLPPSIELLFEHTHTSRVAGCTRVWTKKSENLTHISTVTGILSTVTGICMGSAEIFFRFFRPCPRGTSNASKLIFSLAVAILANTASLICGSESVSSVQGLFIFGFIILRNLELPLSQFCGHMRGTLRASSAMTSHGVYEDLFVSGKCFPQLANPPIRMLHHLNLCQHLTTINNIHSHSHIIPPQGTPAILESTTLQDTQNTTFTNIDHHTAASKSCSGRNRHCPTPSHSDNAAIGCNLPTYHPLATTVFTSLQTLSGRPWLPCGAPHLPPISVISSTTLSTKIASLATYLTP